MGRVVLLDLEHGIYYGLRRDRRERLERPDDGQVTGEVSTTVLAEYDVEEARLLNDLAALASDWLAKDLVERDSMITNHLSPLVCVVRLSSGCCRPHTRVVSPHRVGALLPRLSVDEGRIVAGRLRGGTCLTRSMTVAARVPSARVAIGARRERGTFGAHAWVEFDESANVPESFFRIAEL